MFLHAGASLHGHEYSSSSQAALHTRNTLLRSAFAPPKQRARDGAAAPVLRQRPASDYIPREPSPVVRFREPQDEPPPTPSMHDGSISESELSDTTVSAASARSLHRRRTPRSPRPPRKSTTFFLGYPTPRIIGKTKVMQKVFLPRLLLQLQIVSEDGRSRPVLEVFPASRIAGPVVAPRLSKRFPGIFDVKRHLGYDDIVLVRRDDSDSSTDGTESESDDCLEKRNILAVYSPLKHSDEAEIVLDDGSVWVGKPLENGSYDFIHTDLDGNITKARWARRHVAAATPTSLSTNPSTPSAAPRYTFSILNASTRRHPVLATLTPSTLDVQDTYTSVSPRARHPPITRIGRSQSVTSSPALVPPTPLTASKDPTADCCESDSAIGIPSSPDPDPTPRTVHQIDDATKMLIGVTALWVALRAGWSPAGESAPSTPASAVPPTISGSNTFPPRSNRSRRNTWTRSSTGDGVLAGDVSSSPSLCRFGNGGGAGGAGAAGAAGTGAGTAKRYSMPVQQQKQPPSSSSSWWCEYMNRERGSASVPSTPPATSRASTPVSATPVVTPAAAAAETKPLPPRRATSTGASFMQRRLATSSTSSSAGAGVAAVVEREVVGSSSSAAGEAESGKRALPVLFPSALPVHLQGQALALAAKGAGAAEVKTLSGMRTDAGRAEVQVEEGDLSGSGGKVKKGGVRSRLAKWMNKIGSR